MFLVSGEENIPERIGSKFGLLPVFGTFYCRHHRSRFPPTELERIAREKYLADLPAEMREDREEVEPPPMAFLPCELREYLPKQVPLDATEGARFPQPELPDGRSVVCVPNDLALRPHHVRLSQWKALVVAASAARGPLVQHAYEVSLANLQEWKKVGVETARRYQERTILLRREARMTDDEDPFRGFNPNRDLIDWISRWHERLWNEPTSPFTPSQEAWAVLHRVLGLNPETLRSWSLRSRRAAFGIPANGRPKRPNPMGTSHEIRKARPRARNDS